MLTGRYFLVFWPDEDTYSEVPECKIIGNPGSIGEVIQVKERQKVYTGLLVAMGSKHEVQQKLNAIEVQSSQEQAPQPVTTFNPEPVLTVPTESEPKTSKKQGIRSFVVFMDHCAT